MKVPAAKRMMPTYCQKVTLKDHERSMAKKRKDVERSMEKY